MTEPPQLISIHPKIEITESAVAALKRELGASPHPDPILVIDWHGTSINEGPTTWQWHAMTFDRSALKFSVSLTWRAYGLDFYTLADYPDWAMKALDGLLVDVVKGQLSVLNKLDRSIATTPPPSERPPFKRAVPEPAPLKPGDVLCARYELTRHLGSTGSGDFWLAGDSSGIPMEPVTLAVSSLTRDCPKRSHDRVLEFAAFQATSASPRHPGVWPFERAEFDAEHDLFFRVLRPHEGRTLQFFRKEKTLPFGKDEGLRILLELCAALDAAHGQGFLHMGLSLNTVWLTESGHPLLHSFALCPPIPEGAIIVAMVPAMASPEMFDCEAPSVTDDVYGLGCIAYYILGGTHPYNRESAALAAKAHRRPVRLPQLGWRLNRILAKAVALSASRRWSDVASFSNALRQRPWF